MTKLKISVTKDILEKTKLCGHYNNDTNNVVSNCAVALAVRDIFPHAQVGYGTIAPFSASNDLSYYNLSIDLPEEVTHYIKAFDRLSPDKRPSLHEIEFEVEICDEIINKIDIQEVQNILRNHPTLSLVV